MTGKFGGATSFVRAPGQGLWRSGHETERDNIAVIEVMAAKLAPEFWRTLRERLERELSLVSERCVWNPAAVSIIAAAMVAANWNARITVCGFALFIAASIAWIANGIFEPKNWLIIQNAVLLVINLLGVWRWLPRAGKEAAASRPADRAAR
ncbi:hypothetical protein JEY40_34060 [Bradyrhizobium japonicum]|jgi:hypothetical protein|uniref:Uncharacterized protein n=1 Tax=Bradyrhizobium barranii subsp. barranii TaxID=2823807 RepID=A0A939MG10_9BRAD|nr:MULTISPECIES: hypothetical protein [Bradyrhizobium]AHY49478.1 hypothetical protein BJS_02317 [Bradyrhizobium japonicum SEMIA 5079]MCD9112392.1 hypothetical protein [Bradyrhizobium japonicum]MCD9258389.1 hypothetical protein [Bradyrhizobium japonicum SEMIA 5079]MCD9824153.1 hypothetical protein [Bradyrhizobium japonicum]MCD9896810.1 hypothetical protein [Bradyrhizobium japonicum]